MIVQTVEIDCPPGDPRPDTLMREVIKDTGLTYREPVSKVFGCWTWDYADIPADTWKDAQLIMRGRIIDYHNAGVIRYGSW